MLALDLPELTAEEVSIEVQRDELIVRGAHKPRQAGDGSSYVYAQRPFDAFEHRIQIAAGVDADSITATMQHGVLSLIVPKLEPLKPNDIEIAVKSAECEREAAPASCSSTHDAPAVGHGNGPRTGDRAGRPTALLAKGIAAPQARRGSRPGFGVDDARRLVGKGCRARTAPRIRAVRTQSAPVTGERAGTFSYPHGARGVALNISDYNTPTG